MCWYDRWSLRSWITATTRKSKGSMRRCKPHSEPRPVSSAEICTNLEGTQKSAEKITIEISTVKDAFCITETNFGAFDDAEISREIIAIEIARVKDAFCVTERMLSASQKAPPPPQKPFSFWISYNTVLVLLSSIDVVLLLQPASLWTAAARTISRFRPSQTFKTSGRTGVLLRGFRYSHSATVHRLPCSPQPATDSHAATVQWLLHAETGVHARDGGRRCFSPPPATETRKLDRSKLLHAKAAVDATTDTGWAALLHADSNGHSEIVRLLPNKHTDVRATINAEYMALYLAVAQGHGDCSSKLGCWTVSMWMLVVETAKRHCTQPSNGVIWQWSKRS